MIDKDKIAEYEKAREVRNQKALSTSPPAGRGAP